jgi:hypothetical protein
MNKKAIYIGGGLLVLGLLSFFVVKAIKGKKPNTTPSNTDEETPAEKKNSIKKQAQIVVGLLENLGIGDIGKKKAEEIDKKKESTSVIVTQQGNQVVIDTKPTTTTPPPTTKQIRVVTTKSGTRLRESASTSSKILKTYDSGVVLQVINDVSKSDGTWLKVAKGSSEVGWVRSDVVSAITMRNI